MRQAPPQRNDLRCSGPLELSRIRWTNRRDGSLGEDACQTRTGLAPSLLAQLNSAVLSLMGRVGVGSVARQMRYFDAHPEQALAPLLTCSFPCISLESPGTPLSGNAGSHIIVQQS